MIGTLRFGLVCIVLLTSCRQAREQADESDTRLREIAETVTERVDASDTYVILTRTACSTCYNDVVNYLNANPIGDVTVITGEAEARILRPIGSRKGFKVELFPDVSFRSALIAHGNPIIVATRQGKTRVIVNDDPSRIGAVLSSAFEVDLPAFRNATGIP